MTSSIVPQKQCPKCKKHFPRTREYFVSSKSEPDGLGSYCKNCHRINASEWRLIHGQRLFKVQLPEEFRQCGTCEKVLPATRDYFSTHKMGKNGLSATCKKCASLKAKNYRKTNPDKVKATESKRKRSKEQIEKHKAREKIRYSLDPNKVEKTRKKNINRRARRINAEGFHTVEDEHLQYKAQKGKCWWCECELNNEYEVDHLVPLSRNGTDWPNNIVCACQFCNRSKHDKLPSEWIGRLL